MKLNDEKNSVKNFETKNGNKYKYYNPYACNFEDKKGVKIKVKNVLVEIPNDADRYTIAIVDYSDKTTTRNNVLAFRWNITNGELDRCKDGKKVCIGFPVGKNEEPLWMILPNVFNYLSTEKFIKLMDKIEKLDSADLLNND